MRSILPGVVILPQYFMNHGYITIATGKIYDGRCVNNGRGWVSQDIPSWSRPTQKVNGTRYALPKIESNPKPATECSDMPDKLYKDYHCANNGIEIMNECSVTTLPLSVGFNFPHLFPKNIGIFMTET